MTGYERRCRALLVAYPADYRSARGDEIVGVLLDTGRPGQRWPSLRTAADLIGAGLRARGKFATQGRPSLAVVEGMRVAALIGLCVQAAFSVAMVVHRAHDGMLFYLTNNAWSPAALGLLAAMWVVAFALLVAGRPRLALVPALVASAGSVILLLSNFAGNNLAASTPSMVLIAVQGTLLGVVPTLALVVAATRPSPTTGRHSALWLVAFGGLTVVFAALSTGIKRLPGGGRTELSLAPGSLVVFLFWLCLVALIAMAFTSTFDPRLGVAIIVVSLPNVVYQIGLIVAVEPKPAGPVLIAIAAFVTTIVVAISSAISMRRLRPDRHRA